MVVPLGIITEFTPPIVSIPNNKGVTSNTTSPSNFESLVSVKTAA